MSSSLASKRIDYYPTERDISELLTKAGLPMSFVNDFTRDYAAVKRNSQNADGTIDDLSARVDILDAEVIAINIRIDGVELRIDAVELRLTTVEGEVDTLRIDLDAHIAAQSAHGATGDIVGTDDYASLTTGGTVLQANTVGDANPIFASVPSSIGAAPLVYDQAYADSQTTAINLLSSSLFAVILGMNSNTTQFNNLLSSMRTAKQLKV